MYFPILKTNFTTSFNHFVNVSPSTYHADPSPLFIHRLNYTGSCWEVTQVELINPNSALNIESSSSISNFEVFVATDKELGHSQKSLSKSWLSSSSYPEWRATSGIISKTTKLSASYQGETPVFDFAKSCVFHNIIPKSLVCNIYLMFYSLHSSESKTGILTFYDKNYQPLDSVEVYTNQHNIIHPDRDLLTASVTIVVNGIGGIPFFLLDGPQTFSLEHTHPPISSVVPKQRKVFGALFKQTIFSHL